MATAATAALAAPTAAWDWGALAKEEAEAKLASSPEGTFLVRASASTAGAFSISLVKDGVVSHIRIQNVDGGYIIKKKDKVHPYVCSTIVPPQQSLLGITALHLVGAWSSLP